MRDEDLVGLLSAYDAQLRAHVHDPLPDRVHAERDGPLLRTVGFGDRGFVEYRDLDGLDGGELDELVARQVRIFAERGEPFEWSCTGTIARLTSQTDCAQPAWCPKTWRRC